MVTIEIAGFQPKSYKTLGPQARKNPLFQSKSNNMGIVQGERSLLLRD
jgi:hypothetical protein